MPKLTNDQQRLLLIAPHNSYRITPYIAAAQKLGVEVMVASTSEYSLVSDVAEGLRINLDDSEHALDPIIKAHHQKPFTGVVATDDSAVSLASHVSMAIGLPHNPPEAVQLTRRKDLARECLASHGVPVPRYQRIDLTTDITAQINDLTYPCVIKPLSLSGSRGVIRVDNPEACLTACKRIQKIVRELTDEESQRYLLAESYIPGAEVAVEAMLNNGKLQLLALFDKPDPLEGPYFEETYYITPSRLPEHQQKLITQRVTDACSAYGLVTGPVHAELRLHEDEAWILEVAARTIGGQCAQLLQYGTGHSLEELVILQTTGKTLQAKFNTEAAGVLMIPIPCSGILRRVEGLTAARQVQHIVEVEISVRDGYELIPLPEGTAYLGFIFARGPDPGNVENALREAHAHLNFVTAPVWKLANELN
jgi:biotin carboxylase